MSIVYGSHIKGGNIYYEFLEEEPTGDNKYEIYIESYVECSSDLFSISETAIGIFLGDSLLTTLFIPLDSTLIIPPTSYDCISVPNSCILKALYSTTVILPKKSESYFITQQSCCRGNGISNIIDSGEVGFSYMVEISGLSQNLKNSSPKITKLPPLTVCIDEEIDISFFEEDIENNQLVYQLCSPLDISPNTGTSGLAPPPYPSVPFLTPEFSPQIPLGQGSIVSINANSGLLTIKPVLAGKFVVGICIKEFHNGQLLSTVIRDFLFNVEICTPKANIVLENAIQNSNDIFQLNFCNHIDSFSVNNQSTDTNHINHFYWTFDLSDNTDTIYDWNPTLNFPEAGTYTGQLLLNPGEQCSDTANLIINVNTNISADFEVNYDTCIGGEVEFSNNSISEGGEIIAWNWSFGDNTSSNEEHPNHLFQTPGVKESTLVINNEFECKDTVTKEFDYLPAPPIIVVAPNTFAGCSPLAVFFENLSSPVDSTYDIFWKFGNGDFSTAISPSYIYEESGIYDIDISITSPIGCSIDTSFTQWITVEAPPIADFGWQPQIVSNLSPEATFTDFSVRAEIWEWDFNQNAESFEQHPSYIFPDTGLQAVTLKIIDQYGCQDSLTQWLDVVPEITYYLPNAFTPNQDSKNEIYIGRGVLDGVVDFQMNIWNRWGELIFTSDNPYFGWDGTHFKTGKSVQTGVYICSVKFKTNRKKQSKFHQSFLLTR